MVITRVARVSVGWRQRRFVCDSRRLLAGLVLQHLVHDGGVKVAGRQEGMLRTAQFTDAIAEYGRGLDEEVDEPLVLRVVGGGVFHGVHAADRGAGHGTCFRSEA